MVINVNHIVPFFDTVTKMLQYIHVHSVYCLKSNQIVFYFACYTIWTGMQGSIFLQQMLMVQWQRRSREPWLYWLSNQGPAALLTGWVTIHLLNFTYTVHRCPLAMYLLVLVTCKFVFWAFVTFLSLKIQAFVYLQELFDLERWGQLVMQFRRENFQLHQLNDQSALAVTLQAGLSALKTPYLLYLGFMEE